MNKKMIIKTDNLMEKDWQYLIVFDACRFDTFKKVYQKYLPNGKLQKAISPASNTNQWCKKVFTDKYNDVVYISSNPFINSKMKLQGFEGKKHFYKIYDVWSKGWDENLGTVHPREINKYTKKALKEHPNRRLIIHYMQPHQPYLGVGGQKNWSEIISREDSRKNRTIISAIKLKFGVLIKRSLGRKRWWRIRSIFGLKPRHPMEVIISKKGRKGMLDEYQNNLEIALKEFIKILPLLKGKIIITSDHGELLGENNDYGHYPNLKTAKLIEVPWLKIKN
jgi:hypothetical protein